MEDCSSSVAANGLHHFQYSHSQVVRKVKRHLEETNFTGITVDFIQITSAVRKLISKIVQGKIMFDRSNGVRRVERVVVLSYQPCDGTGNLKQVAKQLLYLLLRE